MGEITAVTTRFGLIGLVPSTSTYYLRGRAGMSKAGIWPVIIISIAHIQPAVIPAPPENIPGC
jgi:hypothetical protein